MIDETLEWMAARGALATGIAAELAAPLEGVYAQIAHTVQRLDRHVATARGPEPLPPHIAAEVRERLADVFLELGRVRRLAASLAAIVAHEPPRAVDLGELLERAVALAHHRLVQDNEILLDLASVAPVFADAPRLTQAIALLIAHTAGAAMGPVEIHTAASGGEVRLTIHAPGPASVLPFAAVIRTAIEADAGRLNLSPTELTLTVVLPRASGLR